MEAKKGVIVGNVNMSDQIPTLSALRPTELLFL